MTPEFSETYLTALLTFWRRSSTSTATKHSAASTATAIANEIPELRRPQCWAARPSPITGSEIAT